MTPVPPDRVIVVGAVPTGLAVAGTRRGAGDLPGQVRVVTYSRAGRPGRPATVLVRPGGYVAGAGETTGEAAVRRAVERWFSAG